MEIGRRQGNDIEITKGLKAGEPVVVLGNYKLKDKIRVRVVSSPPSKVQAHAVPAGKAPAAKKPKK